jgi:hypothetical protein
MTTEEHIEKTLQDLDNAICDLKNYDFNEIDTIFVAMHWAAQPEEELREVLDLLRYRGDSFD